MKELFDVIDYIYSNYCLKYIRFTGDFDVDIVPIKELLLGENI